VALLFDCVLALSKSVPELDALVTRSRDDLSVISRESNRQDILGVTNESSCGGSKVQIPETEGGVPRSRKGKLTIRREGNVLDKVGVSSEGSTWNTIVGLRLSGQVPDHDGLVTRTSDQSIWVFWVGYNCGDPSSVSLEDSS